jgi:hypothetical protein
MVDQSIFLYDSAFVNTSLRFSLSLLGAVSRVMPATHCINSIRRHAAQLSLLALAMVGAAPFGAQ